MTRVSLDQLREMYPHEIRIAPKAVSRERALEALYRGGMMVGKTNMLHDMLEDFIWEYEISPQFIVCDEMASIQGRGLISLLDAWTENLKGIAQDRRQPEDQKAAALTPR